MKQGRASSNVHEGKVEPISKAKNVGKVSDIGLQVVRTHQREDLGRGYKAPMASGSNHKSGSQGKH
jgi:hypothetical protein